MLALNGIDDILTLFRWDNQFRTCVAAGKDGADGVTFRILAGVALTVEASIAAAVAVAVAVAASL